MTVLSVLCGVGEHRARITRLTSFLLSYYDQLCARSLTLSLAASCAQRCDEVSPAAAEKRDTTAHTLPSDWHVFKCIGVMAPEAGKKVRLPATEPACSSVELLGSCRCALGRSTAGECCKYPSGLLGSACSREQLADKRRSRTRASPKVLACAPACPDSLCTAASQPALKDTRLNCFFNKVPAPTRAQVSLVLPRLPDGW